MTVHDIKPGMILKYHFGEANGHESLWLVLEQLEKSHEATKFKLYCIKSCIHGAPDLHTSTDYIFAKENMHYFTITASI